MGLLRFLLALSVVTSHLHGKAILGFRLLYGSLAVECFFMISGFYMALVLNEKYIQAKDYFPFLGQRLLRLFPAFWVVLLLSMVIEGLFCLNLGKAEGAYTLWFQGDRYTVATWCALLFANFFIFGRQILYYLAIDPTSGNLFWTQDNGITNLFVGPAWSIDLEFTFYLLAPFLVRRSLIWQLLIIACSVVLRLTTSSFLNPTEYPWHMDRFFPYELAFFMLGSVAYQIYRHQKIILAETQKFTTWFQWIFFFGILFYSRLPGNSYLREAILMPCLFLMIPVLFYLTKNNAVDRVIGELSYPLYLIHELVIFVLWPFLLKFVPDNWYGPICTIVTVGLAYLIYKFVDKKVDDYRHRLFDRYRKIVS